MVCMLCVCILGKAHLIYPCKDSGNLFLNNKMDENGIKKMSNTKMLGSQVIKVNFKKKKVQVQNFDLSDTLVYDQRPPKLIPSAKAGLCVWC